MEPARQRSLSLHPQASPGPQHPAASGQFPIKMNGSTLDRRFPPPSAPQTGSPLRAGRGQASGLFVSAVPPPGRGGAARNPPRPTARPWGAHFKRNPGQLERWGWAISLQTGGSEVPHIHTHNTKCFPLSTPSSQTSAGASSFALFQEAPPPPRPIQGPPQGGLHLPTLAGLDVNLTLSPSSATHPEVRGAC